MPNCHVAPFRASVHGPNKQKTTLSNKGSPWLRSVTPQSALCVIPFSRFCRDRGGFRAVQKSSEVPSHAKLSCSTLQSQCPWSKQTENNTQQQTQSMVTERHTSICSLRDPVFKILPEPGWFPSRSIIKRGDFSCQIVM